MASHDGPAIPDAGHGFRGPRAEEPGAPVDVAGTIAAVGSAVIRVAVGDEVFGTGRGPFAEHTAARADAPPEITGQALSRTGSPNGNVQIGRRSVDGHWRRYDAAATAFILATVIFDSLRRSWVAYGAHAS
jgi:hypothetical protein